MTLLRGDATLAPALPPGKFISKDVLRSVMLSTVLAVSFTLVLVIGVPALSWASARTSEIHSISRLSLYANAVFSQWILTLLGAGVVLAADRQVFRRGFTSAGLGVTLTWGTGVALAALVVVAVILWCQRQGWLRPESGLTYLLLPETRTEKLWGALIVSPTAAFCEEFLFRGFLLMQMHAWLGSLAWAWIASSVAFGLAHFYQRWSGMVRAGVLGALLAWPVVCLGSLYPAMLAHWIVDAVAMLWLGRWLIRRDAAPAPGFYWAHHLHLSCLPHRLAAEKSRFQGEKA